MNPVDHVRIPSIIGSAKIMLTFLSSLTEVVIINILVKPRPSHGTQHKVKRQVSLQLGGPDCLEVLKRQKISVRSYRYFEIYVASARTAFCHANKWPQT